MPFYPDYKYLGYETLKFWMELYFKHPIHNIITMIDYLNEMSSEEAIDKCNQEFIILAYKITNIMNDKLCYYYDISDNTDYENTLETEDEIEIDSDDPADYLPEKPTIGDILQLHFGCSGDFYDYDKFRDIFKDYKTNFIEMARNNKKFVRVLLILNFMFLVKMLLM